MPDKKTETAPLQTLKNGIDVLTVLADNGKPMLLTEIAAAVNMQPGKAHRYLGSLVATGMLEQYEAGGGYDFGPGLLNLGLAALGRLEPLKIVRFHLEKLSDKINESVLFAIWTEQGPTIVLMKESGHPVSLNVRVGSVMPLLTTSTGLVFSALMPAHETKPFIDAELEFHRQAETSGLPENHNEVAAMQAGIQKRGLARVLGVYRAGINAISAPVFNYDARLEGVITGVGPAGAFDTNWNGHFAREIKEAAKEINKRLGYDDN